MNLLFGVFGKLGQVLTSFGKKKTTIERLEQLDKEIKDYERFKHRSELNQKKYIGALLLYAIIFYIVSAIIYFIYLMPKNLIDRLKTLIPFFITPLLIYLIRKFLKWFYIKRTANYEKKLIDLKEEKKNILEEVKEKETYKKAREILERFSSGTDLNFTPPTSPMPTSVSNTSLNPTTPFENNKMQQIDQSMLNSQKSMNSTLIHRNMRVIQNQQNILHQSAIMSQQQKSTPNIAESNRQINIHQKLNQNENKSMVAASSSFVGQKFQPDLKKNVPNPNNQSFMNQPGPLPPPPPPSALGISQARTLLPRPIINPNRSILDKLLDYMIGEGPNNRYALICKSCHFHNGMALREEFEYVAFRCAYCLFYNEARKTKLCVPKLNNLTSSNTEATNENHVNENDSTLSSSNSFDEMTSETNSEREPISTASGPLATSSTADKVTDIKRKRPLSSALAESTNSNNQLSSRTTSKSMDMLNINEKIRNKENKENENDDSSDELFSNEIDNS